MKTFIALCMLLAVSNAVWVRRSTANVLNNVELKESLEFGVEQALVELKANLTLPQDVVVGELLGYAQRSTSEGVERYFNLSLTIPSAPSARVLLQTFVTRRHSGSLVYTTSFALNIFGVNTWEVASAHWTDNLPLEILMTGVDHEVSQVQAEPELTAISHKAIHKCLSSYINKHLLPHDATFEKMIYYRTSSVSYGTLQDFRILLTADNLFAEAQMKGAVIVDEDGAIVGTSCALHFQFRQGVSESVDRPIKFC